MGETISETSPLSPSARVCNASTINHQHHHKLHKPSRSKTIRSATKTSFTWVCSICEALCRQTFWAFWRTFSERFRGQDVLSRTFQNVQNVLEINFLNFFSSNTKTVAKRRRKNVVLFFQHSFLDVLLQFYTVGTTKIKTPANSGVLLQFQCCSAVSILFGSIETEVTHLEICTE